ncbi:MAG: dihydrolipoamide acyltransferase [Nitrosospira sp.]|nr:dihydrolipoamide acyltransferase [Nitrosospira sp.]
MRSVRRKSRFLPAAALALVAACSTVVENQKPVEPLHSDLVVTGQMEDMMLYYDSLRKHPPAELARVYDKVKQNFVQNKSDANRARLVLLLILPNTSFRDITSALYLLNEWPRDAKPITGLQSFRNLLTALLVEQQRLIHNMDELSVKLKEDQKRVEILQKQIEAIKSMEKNLILREM